MVLLMTPAPIYRRNHPIDKMFSISAPYLLSSPWKPLSTSPIVGTHRVHVPLGCKSFGLFCLHARRTKHEITKHEVCIKKNPKQNKKTGEEGLPAKGVTLFTPHVQAGFSLLHRHALLFGHAHSQATPRMGTPFDGPVLWHKLLEVERGVVFEQVCGDHCGYDLLGGGEGVGIVHQHHTCTHTFHHLHKHMQTCTSRKYLSSYRSPFTYHTHAHNTHAHHTCTFTTYMHNIFTYVPITNHNMLSHQPHMHTLTPKCTLAHT